MASTIENIETVFEEVDVRSQRRNGKTKKYRQWLVFLASFFLSFNSSGQIFSIGVLFPAIKDVYNSNSAEAALVPSVGIGVYAFSGTVSGVIVHSIGTRNSGILGGILMSSGYIAAYFATDIYFVVVAVGVLGGFGASILVIAGMTAAGANFNGKWKTLAISMASTGSGIGGITIPYLLVTLEAEYGLNGTFLVTGGLILNTVVASCIFSPSDISRMTKDNLSRQSQHQSICNHFCEIVKNLQYFLGPVSISIGTALLSSSMVMIVDIFISRGFEYNDGVFALFLMNITSLTGRTINALSKQCQHISMFTASILAYFFAGISMLVLSTISKYWTLLLWSGIIGLSVGMSTSSLYSTTAGVVKKEVYSLSLGLAMFFQGITATVVSPISGHVRDVTGSYDSVFLVLGTAVMLCFLLVSVAFLIRNCCPRNELLYNEIKISSNGQLPCRENGDSNSEVNHI